MYVKRPKCLKTDSRSKATKQLFAQTQSEDPQEPGIGPDWYQNQLGTGVAGFLRLKLSSGFHGNNPKRKIKFHNTTLTFSVNWHNKNPNFVLRLPNRFKVQELRERQWGISETPGPQNDPSEAVLGMFQAVNPSIPPFRTEPVPRIPTICTENRDQPASILWMAATSLRTI